MPAHLTWPLQLQGDHLATVDQDSDDDITQCINVIVATRRGERVELPGFGITDPTFSTKVDRGEIAAAVNTWEPRAGTVIVTEQIDPTDSGVRDVSIVHERQT